MKEMTIEQKVQRYDEALKRAKKLYEQGTITESLSYVFPELKESEDGRIRKEIIAFLKYYHTGQGNCVVYDDDWIAWLEKQGECEIDYTQNHQDSTCPNGCIVLEDFNDGEGFYKVHLDYLNKKQVEEVEEMIRVWNKELKTSNENIKACIGMCLTDVDEQRFKDYNTNLKDCLVWLEKQGEQKPVIEMETPEESLGIDSDTYNKIVDECVYGEQKPAYTKEYDFHGIKFIPKFAKGDIIKDKKRGEVSTIKDFSYDTGLYTHTYGQFPITIQDNYEIIAQNSAWSEEDERTYKSVLYAFEHNYPLNSEQQKFVKSLKDRYTWKPTTEQLRELRCVISGCSFETPILVELEESLKKLREK